MNNEHSTRHGGESPRPAPQPGPFNPAKPIPPYPPNTTVEGGAL